MSFRGGFSSEAALALDDPQGRSSLLASANFQPGRFHLQEGTASTLVTAISVLGLYLLPPCAFPPEEGPGGGDGWICDRTMGFLAT